MMLSGYGAGHQSFDRPAWTIQDDRSIVGVAIWRAFNFFCGEAMSGLSFVRFVRKKN